MAAELRDETEYNLSHSAVAKAPAKPVYQRKGVGPGTGKPSHNQNKAYDGPKTEWTGFGPKGEPIAFKTGKFAGMPYIEAPIEYLQKLASFDPPNAVAVLELNRRMRKPQVTNDFYSETTELDGF